MKIKAGAWLSLNSRQKQIVLKLWNERNERRTKEKSTSAKALKKITFKKYLYAYYKAFGR
ncbi:hypothetical protein [Oceanobacillus aidingensis]|uniref:Uncharacterized protein n=1 Tax=Oceanobacillus aidingensis TaxID=645964 RepID=A0ABV9JV91_9BACI